MNDTRDDVRAGIKRALGVGIAILFVAGLTIGALYQVLFGTVLVALGIVLLAIRGYLGSGDKAVTGVMIFVAFVAVALQAIEYFLAP